MVESSGLSKLAIIGASSGQLPLCLKAKELGIETFCFAWQKGAVCKDVVDHFYPISVSEIEPISAICKENGIGGIVSNASDFTAEIVALISDKLGLNGTSPINLQRARNKFHVRTVTQGIEGLISPRFYKYAGKDEGLYPCIVKPCVGGSKKGVSFVKNKTDFNTAIAYASLEHTADIIIEEYVEGRELSIESISFHGKHYVIQITDKDSSSAPHFVELGHHQPAQIPAYIKEKIVIAIPELLTKLGYTNGASHIEVKYQGDKLFLIEANLRGGGDDISSKLVFMSSGVDYLKCMIEVALGIFIEPQREHNPRYAGIYYLCKQTSHLMPFFEKSSGKEWVVEEQIYSKELKESCSNYERDGYLMYMSDHKITPNDVI